MKSWANLYRISTIITGVLLTLFCIEKIVYSMSAIRYVSYSFDQQFSPQTCAAIENYIALFESNGRYNACEIIEKTPFHFGCIKSMELQQLPSGTALITITAFKPIVQINHDRLLTENQLVLSSAYYATYVVESLAKLTVKDSTTLMNGAIIAALDRCIIEKIFDHYTFYVAGEHEWYLRDMQDPSFTICCNACSLPVDSVRVAYNRLKTHLKKGESVKKKWIADVRFCNQIILSMDTGGRYE